MEKQRLAFNLIYDAPDFCIIKSVLSQDNHLLIDLLPKNKKIFIFFNISWDYEYKENLAPWMECLKKDNIVYYLLSNDQRQYDEFEKYGYPQILINQNCFVDYNIFKPAPTKEKCYSLVMNARLSSFKRHYLLEKITKGIALMSYDNYDVYKDYKDNFFENYGSSIECFSENLNTQHIVEVLNQSKVGAIFSQREGACYASTEYLLCGLPVLSTPSVGGRDLWYNEDNSVICEPDPEAVYEAYSHMLRRDWDRQKIRNQALITSTLHRKKFTKKIQEILNEMGHKHVSADILFYKNFYNKFFHYLPEDQIHQIIYENKTF